MFLSKSSRKKNMCILNLGRNDENPLITFALIAYNQEPFILEAIYGAFSQTYFPLEIILSDDCSQDNTFAIINEITKNYSGHHKIILNRNASNLGITGHVNRIFELANGQLVVLSAGDDISLPDRVRTMVEAWNNTNRKAFCIFSGIITINREGQQFEYKRYNHKSRNYGTFSEERYSASEFVSGVKPLIVGGAAAWSPQLMKVFGPLSINMVEEDEALALRTACIGSFLYISSKLVKYRLHDKNIHGRYPHVATTLEELRLEDEQKRYWLTMRFKKYEAYLSDLRTARNKFLIDQRCYESAIQQCRNQQQIIQADLAFINSSFITKCRLLLKIVKIGSPVLRLRTFIYRLLPTPIYHIFKLWRNRFHQAILGNM